MLTTTKRAEKLTHYLKYQRRDVAPGIDGVLDKLLERERQAVLKQSDELTAELSDFKRRYQLASPDFFEKFEKGKIGDALDFVYWAAAWQVYRSLQASLELVESEKTDQ